MRRASRSLLIIGVGVAMLSGCGRQPAPPARPVPVAPTRVTPLAPAAYVATASSIDLLVVQASQLAQTKARGSSVRELAARLLADHNGIAAQLSFAGRRLNLLPSATMMPRHQAMLDELKGSWDFDAGYKRVMIAAHEEALRVHGDFAKAGNSPTLRPVAEMASLSIRRDLDELKAL